MVLEQPALGRVFAIPELLESILCQLDINDILNAERVQKEWKQLIERSGPLKRILFREPTGISKDEDNPLFIAASDASTKVLTKGVSEPETPILATVEAIIEEFLRKITEDDLDMNARFWAYDSLLKEAGLRSRWYYNKPAGGWGSEVEDIHCDMCQGFHQKLDPKKLHPELRFLGQRPVCTKGKYQKIHSRYSFFEVPADGGMNWPGLMRQYMTFAEALEAPCRKMRDSSTLGSSIASNPAITDLVLHVFLESGNLKAGLITRKKPGGLTVKDFLDMFVFSFRHELEYKVKWAKFLRDFQGVKGMDKYCDEFDTYHRSINELMEDIPAWHWNEFVEKE